MWSQGFVAEAIDRFCRTQEVMDTSGGRHRGVLTADDMARWQPRVEAPVTYEYGRYTVLQGRVLEPGAGVLQQLALLKGFDLDGLDPTGPDFIHLQVEVRQARLRRPRDVLRRSGFREGAGRGAAVGGLQRRAPQADRQGGVARAAARHIPGFGMRIGIRVADGARAAVGEPAPASRRSATSRGRTTTTICPTPSRDGEQARDDRRGARRHRAFRHHRPRRQHGVVDAVRRLAAILAVDSGARLLPRHPRAAVLARRGPSERARARQAAALTLSPTMALRDGEPYLAWGSPGGDQQDQWITQMFLRHVHCGMNLQEAIDAPAWHSEHFPSSFWPRKARPGVLVVEGRLPPETQGVGSAATRSRSGRTGRKAASPPPRATASAARPPPIRAACRATPRGGEVPMRLIESGSE